MIFRSTLSRRRAVQLAAAAPAIPAIAACATASAPASTKTSDLNGTFSFSVQNFQPTINIIEKAIPAFQQKYPNTKISYTPVEFVDMAQKVRAEIAAGSGHDGFHTYTGSWRGADAANFMLALTPTFFKPAELEQIFFANVLNAVYSKKPEIYIMPFSVGVNGSMLMWNTNLTQAAGVDPKTFATLNQIAQGAVKLTRKNGDDWQQAGLLATSHTNLVMR